MYFNEKEREIIRTFYSPLDAYDKCTMLLRWDNISQITATFDTCFDDDNGLEMEDEGYEEFHSFLFDSIEVVGNPPVSISKDHFFLVSYHNFPDEILVDGKKIN